MKNIRLKSRSGRLLVAVRNHLLQAEMMFLSTTNDHMRYTRRLNVIIKLNERIERRVAKERLREAEESQLQLTLKQRKKR